MDKKRNGKIIAGVLVVLVCGVVYLFASGRQAGEDIVTESFHDETVLSESTEEPKEPKDSGAVPEKPEEDGTSKVYIHICGEVKKPGVYTFSKDPRVIEVVKKAGGFTRKADRAGINQAESVTDGTQLVITAKGSRGKAAAGAGETGNTGEVEKSAGGSGVSGGKININQAAKEELMTLQGIGEARAGQIITYREEIGKFQKIEDIMNISGIKDGVFNAIKDDITV